MNLIPHARGIFVLFHLLAIVVGALPAPVPSQRSDWKQPTFQYELGQLAARLQRWGVAVSPERLEDSLWDVSTRYVDLAARARRPFQFYYDHLGTGQSWIMFGAIHHYPSMVDIDIRESGAWRTVYRARSKEQTWNARQFDHLGFRYIFFLYEWPGYQEFNAPLLDWLARRAAPDFPAADAVRLRYRKGPMPALDPVRPGLQPRAEDGLTCTREFADRS